jgi:cell division protein FtsB
MALLLLASAWYFALVAVAAGAAWNAHRRRTQEIAAVDAELGYEERRARDRAAHLARLRQEELAELRRSERRLTHGLHA